MAAAKIKKGDQVIVLSGKDKGRTGEVVKSLPKDGKVVVSGINVAVRHRKASQANPQGGLANAHVQHDLVDPRNFHDVLIAELLGHRLGDALVVQALEARGILISH